MWMGEQGDVGGVMADGLLQIIRTIPQLDSKASKGNSLENYK